MLDLRLPWRAWLANKEIREVCWLERAGAALWQSSKPQEMHERELGGITARGRVIARRITIREMHRRQHEQKLAALACGTFQHVIQVAGRELPPQAGNQCLHVHLLVEIADRRVGAVEVRPVRAG